MCMEKLHILLVENCENEIEFFISALKESGISFMCNTARSTEQAFKILHNCMPDAVFIHANMPGSEKISEIKELREMQSTTVILYSGTHTAKATPASKELNYVQLPANIQTMSRIFKNLFSHHLV